MVWKLFREQYTNCKIQGKIKRNDNHKCINPQVSILTRTTSVSYIYKWYSKLQDKIKQDKTRRDETRRDQCYKREQRMLQKGTNVTKRNNVCYKKDPMLQKGIR